MSFHAILGIAAGLFSIAAYPTYIRDIIRGNTKPSRVTWWVLMTANIVLTLSYYASGARDTIWIPVSYSVGFFIIALLSIKYGEGSWGVFDIASLAGALLSLLIWWKTSSPEIALYLIIAIDFFGLLPTMYKSCKRPWTEDRTAWVLASIASLLNLLAIEQWTLPIASYPIYVVITNVLIVYFIYHRPPVCT